MEGEFNTDGGEGPPSAPIPSLKQYKKAGSWGLVPGRPRANRVGEKDWGEWSQAGLLLHKAGPGSNMAVLLAGAPQTVGFEPVRDALMSVPGVRATHELHLWALTLSYHVASAHLAIGELAPPSLHLCGQPGVLRFCLFETSLTLYPGYP